jgi:hypothetical protein
MNDKKSKENPYGQKSFLDIAIQQLENAHSLAA